MKKPKAKTKVHRAVTHVKAKVKHPKAKTAHEKVSHKPVARKRAWTPDGDVALCSARAVAEAIRIASGRPLSDSAVLDLYWSVASSADAGASILATLRAAQEWQIKEAAIVGIGQRCEYIQAEPFALPSDGCLYGGSQSAREPHALILGLDLPWGEPHAVTYDPADGTWWSWGQPMSPADFPGAVIEEAWQVTWA